VTIKTDSNVVAIDGKTVRGAASKGNKFPLHIVTAFCTKNRLCLGQLSVAEKGNEITAIPQLLDLITLDGCIVTLDAMGCQRSIAEKIRGKKARLYTTVERQPKGLKGAGARYFQFGNSPQNTCNGRCWAWQGRKKDM
jgi:hypothetical protein